jgi:hypothetical protein
MARKRTLRPDACTGAGEARRDPDPGTGFHYRAAFIGDGSSGSELKEVSHRSEAEALQAACRDLRAGYRPIGIWAPGGVLLHSAAAIRNHCSREA